MCQINGGVNFSFIIMYVGNSSVITTFVAYFVGSSSHSFPTPQSHIIIPCPLVLK